jgi:hypothetical protein
MLLADGRSLTQQHPASALSPASATAVSFGFAIAV